MYQILKLTKYKLNKFTKKKILLKNSLDWQKTQAHKKKSEMNFTYEYTLLDPPVFP